MGAATSRNATSISNKLIQSAYNSCPTVGSVNVLEIKNAKILAPPGCNPPGGTFKSDQVNTVDAHCVLNALQSNISDAAAKLNSQSQAGLLGLSSSENIADFSTSLANYTSNKCEGKSSSNMAKITDTEIRMCDVQFVQNATEKVSCEINATQDVASKVANTSDSDSSTLFGGLFSGTGKIWLIIIFIIGAIILLGALAIILKSRKSKSRKQSRKGRWRRLRGGGCQSSISTKRVKWWFYLALCAALILVAIFAMFRQPKRQFIANYNSKNMTQWQS